MLIIKRDGSEENFNIEKIEKAMKKAFIDTYGTSDDALIKGLAEAVKVNDRDSIETTVMNKKIKMTSELPYPPRTPNVIWLFRITPIPPPPTYPKIAA